MLLERSDALLPQVALLSSASSRALDAALATVASSPLLQTLCAGGAAGAVSRTCTAPLDRIKMLAQEGRVSAFLSSSARHHCHPTVTGSPPAPVTPTLRDIAKYVYRTGGMCSFWRGNGVNCLKAGPEQAAAFTARQLYLAQLCHNGATPTFLQNCVVGAAAGLTAQVLLYPMEVVKTRMAVATNGEYRSIYDCFRQSVQRGGWRDLYVGLSANCVGIVPHRGLEMGTFFTLERLAVAEYRRRHTASHGAVVARPTSQQQQVPLPLYATLAISFTASMVSQVVTYPLNLARTKLQTQGVNGRPVRYQGLGHCLMSVLREGGVKGLFAGIVPNMLKAVPSSMLMYVTFRQTQQFLDGYATAHK